MNLIDVEQNVAAIDLSQGFDLIYDLLGAYGLPKASITRLRKGSYDQAESDSEHLWKKKLYYRYLAHSDDGDLHTIIDAAQQNDAISRVKPRFLIVRNPDRLLAVDTRTGTTLDISTSDLPANTAFFLPWAGIEKAELENLNYADVKAAEKMARLYDEIIKHNAIESEAHVRDLNVFFSRLLFCFFAEDTRVFSDGSFTNAIGSYTQADGTDTAEFLDTLFEVLDMEPDTRGDVAAHLRDFGYVNGSLFSNPVDAPQFSAKARRIVLECGTLDWSEINPDIFGSMIQAVVHPGQREGLGMHYTSVENIMRVIRPLFLDDLHEVFDKADTVNKLNKLLHRISDMKIFDPACGSGNFLVIAYKELRRLEHRIIERISDLDPTHAGRLLSEIKLEQFYGIEIDDFAHEMATLSLWLAKHQMNLEFEKLFGITISLIPLRDTGKIVCGNAASLDWEAVCPKSGAASVFVLGNPPYLGGSNQKAEHKADFAAYFGTTKYNRYLDYISIWFLKGAEYIQDGRATLGFVSTNSICQGAHVDLLWPTLLGKGVEITFARTSFPWTNNAKGAAGVTCVIVGLGQPSGRGKRLFDASSERSVPHINPYLAPSANDIVVGRTKKPITPRPLMARGNITADGGHLSLSKVERDEMVESNPEAERFIRPYVGVAEFIGGIDRFCLWIPDEDMEAARLVPSIDQRLKKVATSRASSPAKSTQKYAAFPNRYVQTYFKDTEAILIPRHSSERREYVPLGFLSAGTVASSAVFVAYDAPVWLYGLLQSRMHMVWMRSIGGRIKSDYRYSNSLVYNTFPFPTMNESDEAELTQKAMGVLEAREYFPDKTLADLYDPDKMPDMLRQAHQALDDTVDSLYRPKPFATDTERVGLLLTLYEVAITANEKGLTVA